MTTDSLVKGLNRSSLCSGLLEKELRELAHYARVEFFEGRTSIIDQGKHSHPLYVILDGQVQVQHMDHGDNPMILAQLRIGDHFGEMNLFDPSPSRVAVITTQASHFASFDEERFKGFIFSHPEVAVKILWNLGAAFVVRLRMTDERYARAVMEGRP